MSYFKSTDKRIRWEFEEKKKKQQSKQNNNLKFFKFQNMRHKLN